jgi:hypothetical protein
MNTRAKFRCTEKHQTNSYYLDQCQYVFQAQYDPDLIAEDRAYATATPVGQLTITVDNPNVKFELGEFYYLDFTPVSVEV